MYRYAVISAEETVIEKREFPNAVPADTIKSVAGKKAMRPIETQGLDLPCNPAWQRRLGPVDQVQADKVVEVYTVEAVPINDLAAAASKKLDETAELVRLRFITAGSGQAMVYQEKVEQARDWVAAGSPAEASGFPLIANEIGITGNTAAAVVAVWQAMRSNWRQIAADIEAARLGAKAAIKTAALAGNHESIITLRDQALAALEAFQPQD